MGQNSMKITACSGSILGENQQFFISLIVSQDVDQKRENWGITALPNLETKIVAADSLTPIERPQQAGLRNLAIDEKERALTESNEHYFAARTSKTKRKWRDRIIELRDALAELLEEDRFLSKGAAAQLVHWNPFDQNKAASFFDPEWMFQINSGFDITIGNPPYVRQEEIKHLKENLKQHYECYSGTADLYVYFYERAIKLLKPNGAFAFITSNKWYRAKYGEKLRDWMNRQARIRLVIDFGDEAVFTALAYPTILIATRRREEVKSPSQSDALLALNWSKEHPVEIFPTVFAEHAFPIPQASLTKESWQLEKQSKRNLLQHLAAVGCTLRAYLGTRVFRGITTGFNEAFIIDDLTRSRLIQESNASAEIIKPYMRGQDVGRWKSTTSDRWIIFTRRGIDKRKYPAVIQYLERFRNSLSPKPETWDEQMSGAWAGRKSGNYEWYEIQDNIAYWKQFESLKIVSTKVSSEPTFLLDRDGRYLGNTAYFFNIVSEDRWLLALLNSSVSAFYARASFVGKQNDFYEVQPAGLEAFPVPRTTESQRALLNTLVECVLCASPLLMNSLLILLYSSCSSRKNCTVLTSGCSTSVSRRVCVGSPRWAAKN